MIHWLKIKLRLGPDNAQFLVVVFVLALRHRGMRQIRDLHHPLVKLFGQRIKLRFGRIQLVPNGRHLGLLSFRASRVPSLHQGTDLF